MLHPDDRGCGNCASGWYGRDARLHCGHQVDDTALATGNGENPIWALRKYGESRLIALLMGVRGDESCMGIDCENMDPSDGGDCRVWRLKPEDQVP